MHKLHDFKLYELDTNYRSNQEIVDFASTFQNGGVLGKSTFSGQLESYRSAIDCEKGLGGNVKILARTGSAYTVNKFIKESGEGRKRIFRKKSNDFM